MSKLGGRGNLDKIQNNSHFLSGDLPLCDFMFICFEMFSGTAIGILKSASVCMQQEASANHNWDTKISVMANTTNNVRC